MLIFEREIYDRPKLRARVVFFDFRCLVDNLIDPLVKIATSFYTLDVHRKPDTAVRREGRVDLEALAMDIDPPLRKLPPAPSRESVGDALLPTTLERSYFLIHVLHLVQLNERWQRDRGRQERF